MYHKPKPKGPSVENLETYDNNRFMQSVKERQKEIEEKLKQPATEEN